ncbi:hypothetical protein D1007_53266 [Hordeum vulgare]|nr:hypothetical protein D1007_53266 [Hordeum vulgare]
MGGASVTSNISLTVESEDGDGASGEVVCGDGSGRSLLERAYPQEVWRRGESCLRPERSRVLLARSPSMDALEVRYNNLVLLAMAVGDGEEAIMPVALLAAIEACCGVLQLELSIEVHTIYLCIIAQ